MCPHSSLSITRGSLVKHRTDWLVTEVLVESLGWLPDTQIHFFVPFLCRSVLCPLPWTFCHQTPTWLTPLSCSCLCWNITSGRPPLAVKSSTPVTLSSFSGFIFLLYTYQPPHVFLYVCILLLQCTLHENRDFSMFWSLLSGLCSACGVWSIFVVSMWFQWTSFPLLSPAPRASHFRQGASNSSPSLRHASWWNPVCL